MFSALCITEQAVLQHLIFTICAEFGKFLIFHVLNYSCYRRRKFLIYHQLESANSTFMKVSMMRPRTLLRLTVCNFYSFLFIYVLSSTSSSKKKKKYLLKTESDVLGQSSVCPFKGVPIRETTCPSLPGLLLQKLKLCQMLPFHGRVYGG